MVSDFEVAIIGGGMCGLACAVGLAERGIQVDVFEASAHFQEVGAGVGLGPNAIRALDTLGVLQAVLARTNQPVLRPFTYISGMKGHEHIYDYPVQSEDAGLGIHRHEFLDAMAKLVDAKHVHFNKRCVSISISPESGSRSIIHFSDGTSYETDIVIGADGIRSVVREYVAGSKHLAFTNTVAYRGLVPTQALREAGVKTDLALHPFCFIGKSKHIITFPIHAGKTINIVVFVTDRTVPVGSVEFPPGNSWVTSASQEELFTEFEEWGEDVRGIVECLQKPSKWSIHTVHPPLESYTSGNVALIGDAAHGMLPHLGAGAGQGLEDCAVLVQLLAHIQMTHLDAAEALEAYNQTRLPRANEVLRRSAATGDLYESFGHDGHSPADMKKLLAGIWDFVWRHDLNKNIEEAIVQMDQTRTKTLA